MPLTDVLANVATMRCRCGGGAIRCAAAPASHIGFCEARRCLRVHSPPFDAKVHGSSPG